MQTLFILIANAELLDLSSIHWIFFKNPRHREAEWSSRMKEKRPD